MVKTAVIGVGYLGKFHAEKYAEVAGAELVAVVDTDAQTREEMALHLGVDGVSDYRTLMDAVDAVSVVVPTTAHYAIAREFLEAGVHVLVEKPITETAEQASALIDIARKRGVVLQVGHLERFNSAIRALEPMLRVPRFVESVRVAPYKERGTEVDVVLDLMIHDIDLIQYIVRSPIERIEAVGTPVITDKPDVANARIRFESGCIANVTAGRTSLKTERKIRIFQEACYFSADLHNKMLSIHRRGESTGNDARIAMQIEELQCDDDDALRLEIEAFLDSIRNGKPPVVSGEDGRQALQTAMDIVAQVEEWIQAMSAQSSRGR
jgi:predicted dehydrogenase